MDAHEYQVSETITHYQQVCRLLNNAGGMMSVEQIMVHLHLSIGSKPVFEQMSILPMVQAKLIEYHPYDQIVVLTELGRAEAVLASLLNDLSF